MCLAVIFLFSLIYISQYNYISKTNVPGYIEVKDKENNANKPEHCYNHLTCPELKIDEIVKPTKNPDYYLKYTINGELHKGGTLVIDERQAHSKLTTTIYGHNIDEPGIKFSDIASLWETSIHNRCDMSYYDGDTTRVYNIWGAFRINATDVDLVHPDITKQNDISKYLTRIQSSEGWNIEYDTSHIKSVLILVTCTEALINDPHRTIVIFIEKQ